MKWLPLTDDNGNCGTHLKASPLSIRRLITGRASVRVEIVWYSAPSPITVAAFQDPPPDGKNHEVEARYYYLFIYLPFMWPTVTDKGV